MLADKVGNAEFFQVMNKTSPNLCLLVHLMFAGQKKSLCILVITM